MIQIKDIHKEFDNTPILKGITTEFKRGKTNLVIGQSGSGKTVFLKSLIGLHIPDDGSIIFDGKLSSKFTENEKQQWRQEIGMVFQGSALLDSQTVEENVMFPLKMFTQQSHEVMLDRVNFVLKRVNLENSNKKLPAELSGGMQKRVSLGRAIFSEPDIIFFDEPTTGLDPITADVINKLILEKVNDLGATALTITHDMSSARTIASKVYMLHEGNIIWGDNVGEMERTKNEYILQFVNGQSDGPIKIQNN